MQAQTACMPHLPLDLIVAAEVTGQETWREACWGLHLKRLGWVLYQLEKESLHGQSISSVAGLVRWQHK